MHVFPIQIPPLREHRDDIVLVAGFFIQKFGQAFGRKTARLTPPALKKLKAHQWSDNIRDLKKVIERAMILCKETLITTRHLILHDAPESHLDEMTMDQIVAFLIGDGGIDLEDWQMRLVCTAMTVARQNVSRAACWLHLSRPALRYRWERLEIVLKWSWFHNPL